MELAEICKSRQVIKLLVEHHIVGTLSTMEVFEIAKRLPDLYRGIHVAFVIHRALIPDNPKFLETVARNRGALGRLFSNVTDAETWLLSL